MAFSRSAYEASAASRCWWQTAYRGGWDHSIDFGHDLREDSELAALVASEPAIGPLPTWANAIIDNALRYLPPCGHADFPRAYTELVEAIGAELPPHFIHGCYTAWPDRKRRLADIIFSLDAWLAGASAEQAAQELRWRRVGVADWDTVCADLWRVLGGHDEVKDLLVERIILRQRWWCKSLAWHNDLRTKFAADSYGGPCLGLGGAYGHSHLNDPYFAELDVARVARLEDRLAELCPDWPWFRDHIRNSWLCAPKAFRFLEVVLWSVGRGRPRGDGEPVPSFLGVEGTWLPRADVRRWWDQFLAALDAWWPAPDGGGSKLTDTLGEWTPTKSWLVRLTAHRMRVQARDTVLGRWLASGGRSAE